MNIGNFFSRIKKLTPPGHHTCLILLFAYFVYLGVAWQLTPTINNVRIIPHESTVPETITLPYISTTALIKDRGLLYDMDIEYEAYQTANFHLSARGCIDELIVNSVSVPLGSYSSQRCSLDGFSISLSPYLNLGKNTLHLRVFDNKESNIQSLNVKPEAYPLSERPFTVLLPLIVFLYFLWPAIIQNALKDRGIFIGVLLWSILVRLPYFFPSWISIDESTFILMGMDILNGNLPYVNIIDNKPPLVFLIFAIFQLFADDIIEIRFIGALWVGLTGYILYLTCKRIGQTNAGIWAAFLYPAFLTLGVDGGCVMTEVIAMLPLSGFIYFLFSPAPTRKDAFLMGLCLGLALLIRTNLLVLAPAILLLFSNPFSSPFDKRNFIVWLRHAFPLGIYGLAGIAAPSLLVGIIYAISGHFILLIKSIYYVPIAFSYGNIFGYTPVKDAPFLEALSFLLGVFFKSAKELYLGANRIIYDVGIIACIWGLFFCKDNLRKIMFKLFVLQLLCAASIVASKNAFHHYFLQLIPVFSLLIAMLAAQLFQNFRAVMVGLYILIIALQPILKASNDMYQRWQQYEPLQRDGWYLASEYIKQHGGAKDEYIFSCFDAVLYFLTKSKIPPVWYGHMDVLPLHGVVQLGKFMGATRYEYKHILEDVFDKKPKYVFAPDWHTCLNEAATILENDYILVKEFEYHNLYKRKE